MSDNLYTVLLVEDEEDIRNVYAEVLIEEGFKVVGAADGDTGLKSALNDKWDVLLLDIMLPGEDGLQILKSVKENIRLKFKPVILLTNLGNESIVNQAFKEGADGYLVKSQITPDQIVKEIRQYLK
ncbi:MAG: response regulator [Patescibacteria group bacterium]|mgnify:CR=1 FL=1